MHSVVWMNAVAGHCTEHEIRADKCSDICQYWSDISTDQTNINSNMSCSVNSDGQQWLGDVQLLSHDGVSH